MDIRPKGSYTKWVLVLDQLNIIPKWSVRPVGRPNGMSDQLGYTYRLQINEWIIMEILPFRQLSMWSNQKLCEHRCSRFPVVIDKCGHSQKQEKSTKSTSTALLRLLQLALTCTVSVTI